MTTPRSTKKYLSICVAVLLALTTGYLMSASNGSYQLWVVAFSIGGLIMTVSFFSPRFAFYALVISAMFSRFGIPISGVSIRPDQVVLMLVLVGIVPRLALVALGRRDSVKLRLRKSLVPGIVIAGFAMYIGTNVLSSILFSPQLTESLKIVAWLLLSFTALTVAYLVVGKYVGVREALLVVLVSGFVSAAVGIFLFLLFRLTGSTFGVQQGLPSSAGGASFKLYGTFFEANIFGSFQAFSAITGIALLQLKVVRGRASALIAFGTGFSVVALALSFTRASWIAFLVGLAALVFFQWRHGRLPVLLPRLGILALMALAALVPTGLLGNLQVYFTSIATFGGPSFYSDTLAFRLVRFKMALAEWPTSPLLGLGTNSFGQRHLDPSQNYAPDYLGGLFIGALYDVGLVGLLVLLAMFGVVLVILMRMAAKDDKKESALALALLCGVISFLVSYQVTNAFWFSYNWIIIAIVLRLYESWLEARKAAAARACEVACR